MYPPRPRPRKAVFCKALLGGGCEDSWPEVSLRHQEKGSQRPADKEEIPKAEPGGLDLAHRAPLWPTRVSTPFGWKMVAVRAGACFAFLILLFSGWCWFTYSPPSCHCILWVNLPQVNSVVSKLPGPQTLRRHVWVWDPDFELNCDWSGTKTLAGLMELWHTPAGSLISICFTSPLAFSF